MPSLHSPVVSTSDPSASMRAGPSKNEGACLVHTPTRTSLTPDYCGIFSVITAIGVSTRLRHTTTVFGRATGVPATIHGNER